MRKFLSALLVLALGTIAIGWASQDPDLFEDAIQAFEAADREQPPRPGQIVFIGSSSFRLWKTLPRTWPRFRC